MTVGGAIADLAALGDVPPGSHVCWIVGDQQQYVREATRALEQARTTNEKPVVFGPEGSAALAALAPYAALAADPLTATLRGGPLDPEAMFAMFDVQSAVARSEGYRGLRLVADMDWLLPVAPTTDELVAFELLLDRHMQRFEATIVCAYREGSWDTAALGGTRCVHPVNVGSDAPAQFRLVAGDAGAWRLLGEVDIAVVADFRSALTAAVDTGVCVLDASAVSFVDLAGMRHIADAARSPDVTVRIVGAPAIVRRGWTAAGFAAAAPTVELAG